VQGDQALLLKASGAEIASMTNPKTLEKIIAALDELAHSLVQRLDAPPFMLVGPERAAYATANEIGVYAASLRAKTVEVGVREGRRELKKYGARVERILEQLPTRN
jgi:hypothetical protein